MLRDIKCPVSKGGHVLAWMTLSLLMNPPGPLIKAIGKFMQILNLEAQCNLTSI